MRALETPEAAPATGLCLKHFPFLYTKTESLSDGLSCSAVWGLTGVLGKQGAALAVDNLLDDRHVGGYGWGRDQADARHHGVYGCDEAQAGVEPLDAQRV